jgi:hypothetical protein
MEKLKEIEQLLSYIPTKSVDEFANINNGKKNKNSNFKINTEKNALSFNEISNKINEKINNFNTNKGKKKNRNKGEKDKKSINGNTDNKNQGKSKEKKPKKTEEIMETN